MSKIQIFDPAMCCSTGVCGPSVNPNLIRVNAIINNFKRQGIIVERYSINNNPQMFVDNTNINDLIKEHGIGVLPITVVDGIIVKTKEYLTNDEFAKYLNVKVASLLISNNLNKFGIHRK
jgi:hypothetical protein